MVKFLIINCGSLVDIELSTLLGGQLKADVENAEIHYLTREDAAPMLEKDPHIDRVHIIHGKSGKIIKELGGLEIDYIIDLQNNALSARVKLRLKRMDFTLKGRSFKEFLRNPFKKEVLTDQQKLSRYMDCIRHFTGE